MSVNPSERVTVYLLSPGDRPNYQLQWVDPTSGKRRTRSAGTSDPDEAETVRRDFEYELNHGLYTTPDRVPWSVFRERFEDEFTAARRENTRENYAATLDAFERLTSVKRVSEVTARTVSGFVAKLRSERGRRKGKTTAPSTVKVRLQFLRTVLRWAVAHGYLAAVPEFPAVKVPKRHPQPVAEDAVERLIAAAEDVQLRVYLLAGWCAGLRLAEAYALSWEPSDEVPWIDLGRDRIVLPADLVKADADQWVPLDPTLRAALLELPRNGSRVFTFRDRRKRGGGREIDAQGVGQRVRALARKVGLNWSMKVLRRGFGCRYAGKVPAQVLQRLMRHANIRTTLDYYANLDDAVEAAVLGPPNARPNAPPATAATDEQKMDAKQEQPKG